MKFFLKNKFIGSILLTALSYHPLVMAQSINMNELTGSWQVKNVYIDTHQTIRPSIIVNDPNLVGRVLSFQSDKIWGDPLDDAGCIQPELKIQPDITLNNLLALTTGAESEKALSENYLLGQQGNKKIRPFIIQCQKGMVGPEGEKIDNWLTMLNENTMLINWDDNTLLALQKLPQDAPAAPSFNCHNAGTSTEKAICGSFDLAAWDHSVSDAFQMAISQINHNGVDVSEKTSVLKSEQRRWLAARNSCKDDKSCIKKYMVARVSDLVESAR